MLEPLHEHFGIDISNEAIMKAVEQHNEVCRLINEIGDYRKLDNPTITGYEFHVINLVTLVCPKELILPYLRETAEELKTREPDMKWPFRCKVVLAGSENDDPDFTKLIESCGAEVVCDRYCYGAVESRIPIEIKEGDDPLYVIARHYLETSNCPRFCRRTRCAQERDASRSSPRNTTPTASSSRPTSSASTGAMSVSSTRSFSRVTSVCLSAPSRRNT